MVIVSTAERIVEILENNTDAFGNNINERTNVLDLPAHYPISPERWTLSVDGTRVFPQYGSVAQYSHEPDRHILSPNAGETVVMRSAERPRYVVAFELAATFAFSINQELQTGDSIRVGMYDGSDGYYLEHSGNQNIDKADFVMERNGTVVYRKENRALDKALTEFTRIRLQTGWYNITRQTWEQSYADPIPQSNDYDKSIQFNPEIATGDMGTERGPVTGNLPVWFEVTASADTTTLELEAGSAAQVNLGNTTQFNRSKKFFATDSITVTGEWEPVRALRVDPNRNIINVQLSNVSVGKFTSSDDAELLLMAGDPSKVLDANGNELADVDFTVPPEASAQNNVIQETTTVDQFPDSTGTPQTSMVDPGGWQLARSELLNESGNELASSAALGTDAKRPIYSRDYAVVLLKSDSTGDVRYQIQTEQDW